MEMLGSLFAPAVPGGLLTGSSGEDHCDPGIHHVSKGTLRGQRAQITCHLSKLVQACVLGEVPCGNSRRGDRCAWFLLEEDRVGATRPSPVLLPAASRRSV